MNLHEKLKLESEYRLLKRLTALVYLGKPRQPATETQHEWWKELRCNVIKRIREARGI